MVNDFADYLEANLTLGNFTVRKNRFYDEDGTNNLDNQICLSNKVNGAPVYNLDGVAYRVRRLQILLRCGPTDPEEDALDLMGAEIITQMDKLHYGTTIGNTKIIGIVGQQSDFSYLNDDVNDRPIYSCNWEMKC